jgi:hypothetical protein
MMIDGSYDSMEFEGMVDLISCISILQMIVNNAHCTTSAAHVDVDDELDEFQP